jgi:hypothetical protein
MRRPIAALPVSILRVQLAGPATLEIAEITICTSDLPVLRIALGKVGGHTRSTLTP